MIKLSGPNFIIKDLPSVLILIIADQMLNDSLRCAYKYNWCLCRFIGKLYILLWTFLINLSDICIIVHGIVQPRLIIFNRKKVILCNTFFCSFPAINWDTICTLEHLDKEIVVIMIIHTNIDKLWLVSYTADRVYPILLYIRLYPDYHNN